MKNILLVEDEPHLAQGLQFNLEREGYRVTLADDGQKALDLYKKEIFDLMILDIMLPILDGYEVAIAIRKEDLRFPILMLSAKTQDEDRVKGLETGADDYITKPFHLKELLLRVNGMFRRTKWYSKIPDHSVIKFGKNQINLTNFEIIGVEKKKHTLTIKETMIMKLLYEKYGQSVSREELLQEVWGYNPDVGTRTVDNFISHLRKYFEEDPHNPQHILTVRGKGYRLLR